MAILHSYFLISKNRTKFTRTIHFMLTVAITITLIVFFLVLVPELGLHVATLAGSIETHLIAPIAAIFYFIRFEDTNDFKKNAIYTALILPLIYVFLIFILSGSGMTFISDAPVPYFFLNYERLGWFRIADGRMGVVYWMIALAALVLVLGYAILKLNKTISQNSNI